MKVMQIESGWGTANIKLANRPVPEPGPGEVVITIEAVSINPRDRVMAEGGYGKRGGCLPLVPLCAGTTAWNALIVQGGLVAGQSVLLQGTGGVSLFALQIAKMIGARVLIISSSDEKLERAKALGADHCINYHTVPDWHLSVRQILDGDGIDHIIEIGGTNTIAKSLRAIKPSGVISLVGVLGGASPELELARVVTRNVRLQGVTVGSREVLENLAQAYELSGLRPVVEENHFAFDKLGIALDSLAAGRHFGKIVCKL